MYLERKQFIEKYVNIFIYKMIYNQIIFIINKNV